MLIDFWSSNEPHIFLPRLFALTQILWFLFHFYEWENEQMLLRIEFSW